MSDIDAEVERLVGTHTARLDPNAAAARTPPVSDLRVRGSAEKNPLSTNKSASELLYKPANEARDVSARLNEFSRQSLGTPTSSNPTPSPDSSPNPNPDTPAAPGASPAAIPNPDGSEPSSTPGIAQPPTRDPLVIDLQQSFRLAQSSAREFRTAEEDYILTAIRLLIEQHRWTPRLSNDTSITIDGSADNGRFENAVRVINDLKVTQRLPFGGQVEAGWVWNATEQLRKQATSRYTNSSELVLKGNIPLLKDAGLIAQESLIQSERDLVYQARVFERFRRQLLVQIANDYFSLLLTQSRIANQEKQLESLRHAAEGNAERVKAGRIRPFEQAITDNSVLSTESALAGLRDSYILQLDRFKVRLGLDVSQPLAVTPLAFDLPEPDVSLDQATSLALDYRLDLQNQRDRLEDSRRAIANARNQLLPDLNLGAAVAVPTDRGIQQPGLEFDPNDLNYSGSITLGLPLDKEIERLGLRQSIISLQRAKREYDRARDDIVVSVRSAVRRIELARFQLLLAEQGVKIAERRREEQLLKADEVEPQKLVDSENALVDARNARDQARTDLRNAVLNYLLESDQLRVARDGVLEPLPGMNLNPDSK